MSNDQGFGPNIPDVPGGPSRHLPIGSIHPTGPLTDRPRLKKYVAIAAIATLVLLCAGLTVIGALQ